MEIKGTLEDMPAKRAPRYSYAPVGALLGLVLGPMIGLYLTGAYASQCGNVSRCHHVAGPQFGLIVGAVAGCVLGAIVGAYFRRHVEPQ